MRFSFPGVNSKHKIKFSGIFAFQPFIAVSLHGVNVKRRLIDEVPLATFSSR